jgi:4'-phosphopantetheinyl transferase EntD
MAGFIQTSLSLLADSEECIPAAIARFDVEAFSPALFAEHGMECPPALRGKPGKRLSEYLAGRICARAVLDLHGHPGYVLLAADNRAPLWPADIVGSITHNRHYAAATAYPRRNMAGMGIDIETVIAEEKIAAIGSAIMTPGELACLHGMAQGAALARLVTAVFSAKESFFKAAFAEVNRWFDFDAVELVQVDPPQSTLAFRCVADLSPRLARGTRFSASLRMLDASTVLTAVLLRTA